MRADRQLERRFKAAQFRERKSLEDFDWSFNPSIPRKQVYDLASCRFLREGRDVLWLGPPGRGQELPGPGDRLPGDQGRVHGPVPVDLRPGPRLPPRRGAGAGGQGVDEVLKPELLIIDDMGMKQLPRRSGECLFEVVMRRYETRSTMMTSNRPLEDWGKLLGDVPSATAILDRFLHHAEVVRMTGRSYRLRHQSAAEGKAVEDSKPAKCPPARKTTDRIQNQPMRPPARKTINRIQNQPKRPPGRREAGSASKPAKAPSGSGDSEKGGGKTQKNR